MYSGTLKLRNLGRRELHLFLCHSDGSSSNTITCGELFGLFELCAELPGVQDVNVELLAQLPQLDALLLLGFGELHVAEDEQSLLVLGEEHPLLGGLNNGLPGRVPAPLLASQLGVSLCRLGRTVTARAGPSRLNSSRLQARHEHEKPKFDKFQ